ncbi:Phage DNA binding protein Roi [Herbaspirillum rubrisubalbicans M1]|uniref:phage antirepressor KilAC domain-containing protein n=1 Tax=Herbaspirillum rubrisubalbicans TaxID=80842 RepID=UPI00073AA126|nr:phage antirepressor KilAC domain-containing protein [Herbaspirillum rubrisubalbicans]ALU90034.1 Phage DNA binding protein Roi [Herbaspirillum rubrisubalbicans M1]
MTSEKKKAVALAGVTASDTAVSGANYSAASGFVQTMSSREIAELVNSRHDKVKQSIERLAAREVIALPPMGEYLDGLGRPASEYRVCKRDSYVIVAQLSPEFTARLVDRWQELELGANIPGTFAAALRLAADQHEQLERHAAQIAQQAPKVALAESICRTDAVCKMGVFAKTIGWGPNRFIERLRNDEILMQNNLPFQRYLDRGYFRVIERKPWTDSTGHQHPTFSTMITGTGQEWLAKRYGKAAGGAGEGF